MKSPMKIRREWLLLAIIVVIALAVGARAPVFLTWRNGMDIANDSAILAILVMMSAIKNPEGPVAFWFSMIPFTSPVVMMARIPFGVPYWQLGLSMVLLIATFVAMVWAAGKIYRTGILMYGKKASWKELGKWLTYKS